MSLITKKCILLAKEEATYADGTTTPDGTNNALEIISDLALVPAGEFNARSPYGNTLSPSRGLLGKHWVEVSFIVELKGSGTAGTAPKGLGDLFEACGMAESVASTVTYLPTSSSFKSAVLWIYVDGLCHKVTGCRGSFKLLCVVGQTAKIEFKMIGLYTIPTDIAMATPTYDTTVPPLVLSAAYTWDTDADISYIQQLELDIANVVVQRESLNAATGIAGLEIVGREPKGSFNPEAVLVAGHDIWTDWTSSTEKAITITIGSTSGNKYVITAPKCVLESVGYGDRNGIRTFELPFRMCKNAGNDELSIVHST
jgi:hypothetical protein